MVDGPGREGRERLEGGGPFKPRKFGKPACLKGREFQNIPPESHKLSVLLFYLFLRTKVVQQILCPFHCVRTPLPSSVSIYITYIVERLTLLGARVDSTCKALQGREERAG